MKPALLVIDVQKAFFDDPVTKKSLDNAIEYINAAIEIFRKNNNPIVCIQHVDESEQLVPGEDGFDLPDSLKILAEDFHIYKTYGNGFNKTGLEAYLRGTGSGYTHRDRILRRVLCPIHLPWSTRPGLVAHSAAWIISQQHA